MPRAVSIPRSVRVDDVAQHVEPVQAPGWCGAGRGGETASGVSSEACAAGSRDDRSGGCDRGRCRGADPGDRRSPAPPPDGDGPPERLNVTRGRAATSRARARRGTSTAAARPWAAVARTRRAAGRRSLEVRAARGLQQHPVAGLGALRGVPRRVVHLVDVDGHAILGKTGAARALGDVRAQAADGDEEVEVETGCALAPISRCRSTSSGPSSSMSPSTAIEWPLPCLAKSASVSSAAAIVGGLAL